ncbi:hypothetical protein PPYR_02970 [Photinus pyralis]|uniref:Uncharacterized protein n=1 Tax=Photinus pyralis TaxID=7054 RepID=A0A5N4A1G4_PHOPY|nr:general odorant-binding protein 57d [Photinus pyralis]KAB0791170.1 hypothetical protein PPYR_02970 [Photinus pyralis]
MFRGILYCFLAVHGCAGLNSGDLVPPGTKLFMDQIGVECTKKIGIPRDFVKSYEFSDQSRDAMCYMECLLQHIELIESDGQTMHFEKMKSMVPPEIADKVLPAVDKCKEEIEISTEACRTSYNFFNCIHDNVPRLFYMGGSA